MAIGRPYNLTPNIATKNISVTATEGQTQFTVTGGYRINEIAVYRNGTRLVDGSDFTARDGSIVTLLSGCTVGDTIEFAIYDSFNVASAIVSAASTQTIEGSLTVTGTLEAQGGSNIQATVGIQSGGTTIGTAQTINFIGSGNTVVQNGNVIDVSISGSAGGGGLGTAINYDNAGTASPFSYIDKQEYIAENMVLDTTTAGFNTSIVISVVPSIVVASGIAVTVGAGKTLVIDVLQIGDLV